MVFATMEPQVRPPQLRRPEHPLPGTPREKLLSMGNGRSQHTPVLPVGRTGAHCSFRTGRLYSRKPTGIKNAASVLQRNHSLAPEDVPAAALHAGLSPRCAADVALATDVSLRMATSSYRPLEAAVLRKRPDPGTVLYRPLRAALLHKRPGSETVSYAPDPHRIRHSMPVCPENPRRKARRVCSGAPQRWRANSA